MNNRTYKLKDICSIKSGKRIPLGMDFTTDITDHPYIRARDIKGGKIKTDELIYLEDAVYDKIKRYIINAGDIAITIVGASVGDVSYAQDEVDGYNLTENAARLTSFTEEVNNKYLYYLLSQPQYHDYMQIVAGGSAQPKLGIYKVERIKVQLPDIIMQRKVVNILSQYDELIENNNKRIKILEEMAENLYKEWFVRYRFPGYEHIEFENGIPKTWLIGRLETILSLRDSQRVPLSSMERDGMEQNYPYYGAADRLGFVEDYIYDGKYLLLGEDGSVVTSEGYPYLQYVWGKFWVNNHAHVCESNGVFSVEYQYCMFKHMNIQDIVTGVAQPKISKGRLLNKKIIIPDEKLVVHFDALIQPIFEMIRNLTEENNILIYQRDLMLPRLMSGKLEV